MATSASKFRRTAATVSELLDAGLDAEAIKNSMGKVAALDLP